MSNLLQWPRSYKKGDKNLRLSLSYLSPQYCSVMKLETFQPAVSQRPRQAREIRVNLVVGVGPACFVCFSWEFLIYLAPPSRRAVRSQPEIHRREILFWNQNISVSRGLAQLGQHGNRAEWRVKPPYVLTDSIKVILFIKIVISSWEVSSQYSLNKNYEICREAGTTDF